jgi:hypothetical protein
MTPEGAERAGRFAPLPRYVLGGVALVTLILFVIACFAMKSHGGAHRAYEVLIGVRSPVGQDVGLALALSVLGYAFVPVVLATVAAEAISALAAKNLTTLDEAKREIVDDAKKTFRRVAAATPATAADPASGASGPKTSKG